MTKFYVRNFTIIEIVLQTIIMRLIHPLSHRQHNVCQEYWECAYTKHDVSIIDKRDSYYSNYLPTIIYIVLKFYFTQTILWPNIDHCKQNALLRGKYVM